MGLGKNDNKSITVKMDFAEGNFDLEKGEIICVAKDKYKDVHLCFKERGFIAFAEIKLYSGDRFAPKEETFSDAYELGTEISRRWSKANKNCHNCHYLNGESCLNEKIPDSDTSKYIEFSGCGLHIAVNGDN